jgi:hypothetical protein
MATQGSAWNDLMKVHSSVRMPSPLLNSLTRRITRNRRKKLMEIMLPPGCNGKGTRLSEGFHNVYMSLSFSDKG